jgi:hypothetical protein
MLAGEGGAICNLAPTSFEDAEEVRVAVEEGEVPTQTQRIPEFGPRC